ncbi:dipeptidase [Halospeciosus flavus]|uniref:Dipeptidase n=1 Tax=Halospeciosus flavus TaxID=3032283 RepID=A0ABD5Z980_9EURY|nr:dipeptidase [Halospeciosus flavus]
MNVVDGHNDLLLRLWESDVDPVSTVAEGDAERHVDLPRAREGNLAAGFFAVFVPNEEPLPDAVFVPNEEPLPDAVETDEGYRVPSVDPIDQEYAKRVAYEQLELLHRLAHDVDDFRVVTSAADVEDCLAEESPGALGAIPHLEGAEPVARDLSNLDFLAAAGVRSIGPAWSRDNAFADGVPFEYPGHPDAGGGLTDAGRDLVRACEERGILVDCAHLTEQGFRDVAAATDAPLVVSHTAAHALVSHTRNLTDEQLAAVADTGGVVGITFGRDQLRDAAVARSASSANRNASRSGDDADQGADVPLAALVDHVEYVADVAGVEHVALGSDFDGATVPEDVGDVTGLPDVLDALRERGFDEAEVEQVAHGNWLRVLRDWWGE